MELSGKPWTYPPYPLSPPPETARPYPPIPPYGPRKIKVGTGPPISYILLSRKPAPTATLSSGTGGRRRPGHLLRALEFDFLLGFRNLCHRTLQSYGFGGGDDADVVENILGDGAGTVRCLFAFDFSVHDVHADVVEMRFL